MNIPKYKQLFELSPIATILLDLETCDFLEVNKAFEELFQYSKEELSNLCFWNMVEEENIEEFQKLKEILKRDGKLDSSEKECFKKNAEKCNIKINGFLIDDNGKEKVWLQLEDITKQKETSQINQDNKELLEYIATEDSLLKVLKKIVDFTEKRCPNSKCSILLLDEEKKHLITTMAPSLPDSYNKANHRIKIGPKIGSCGSAAFLKERVIVENIDEHENWQKCLEFTKKANLHACWSQPIFSLKKELLGTFAIYFHEAKKPSEYQIRLIETYANIASKAIEKDIHIKKLDKSNRDLNEIFENTLSGLVYVSKDRILIKANQRAADILGYENAEEMIDLDMKDIHLSKKRYLEFGDKNFYSLAYQPTFNVEYQFRKKDGTAIWCELSGKALDKNRPADLSKGVLWTINDISLRKKYQEKLIESELLNKNILSTLPNLVWLKNKEGKYLSCNRAFEETFGLSQNEILGKTDYYFESEKTANEFRRYDEIAMNTDELVTYEEWVTVSNGKDILLETTKKVFKNKNDEILGVLGSSHNITKRKQREKELEDLNKLANELTQSQNILLSLFDKGDSVLFIWKNSEKWEIEYVSQSASRLFEYDEEDFLSNKILYPNCIDEQDIKRVRNEVNHAIENDLDYFKHKPYRIITKSGKIKWVLDYTVTQKDESGKITHFIGYVTDITDQIKNQEIVYHQSKIASLGEMLGNISHQWRQPLSAISTVSSGLKLKDELDMLDEKDIERSMDIIKEHVEYLSRTIEDFRCFFDTNTDIKKNTNIKNSIDVAYTLIKDAVKAYNITCVINTEDAFKVCNENIFIQAIINIFNNAQDAIKKNHKFEQKNYIFVDLLKEENQFVITIKDNAGGIPDDIVDKIFEPYFTTKHQSQGTGIGLYMTNQIVTKHLEGQIIVTNKDYEYENEKYTGACFELIIPN